MKLIRFIIAVTLFIVLINPAHAYGRRQNVSTVIKPSCNFFMACENVRKPFDYTKPKMWINPTVSTPFVPFNAPVHGFIEHEPTLHTGLISHPVGCPHTAFCGCGAAVHLFGHPIQALMAAAHWFRFPSASPAPRMAAVRQHHVMVLERHIRGSIWLVYDANSGHHATRVHEKSIAGYRIVAPHL